MRGGAVGILIIHSVVGSGLLGMWGNTCWGVCAEEARGMDGEGEGACVGLAVGMGESV